MVMQSMTITVHGITSPGCAQRVEQALRKQRGVIGVRVNLAAGDVTVIRDPAHVGLFQVVKMLDSLGYDVPFKPSRTHLWLSRVAGWQAFHVSSLQPWVMELVAMLSLLLFYLGLLTLMHG